MPNTNGQKKDYPELKSWSLDPEQIVQYRRMAADYHSMHATSGNEKADALAKQCIEKLDGEETLSRADFFAFEIALLRLQPDRNLAGEARRLRGIYRDVAGPRLLEEYIASDPCGPNTDDYPALRGELDRLLAEIHRLQVLIPKREKIRDGFTRNAIVLTFVALLLGLAFASWVSPIGSFTLEEALPVVLACISGCVGGFMSLQQRLQNLPSEGVAFTQLRFGKFGVYLAPASGAVFALLLYFMFMGNLLSGELFPKNVAAGLNDLTGFGKLLVWSFIAGFAERFVPDALNHLIRRSQVLAESPITSAPLPAPQSASAAGGVAVSVEPPQSSIAPSAGQQFQAKVTGTALTAVKWSVKEADGGMVDSTGLYTAPAKAGVFHVVATLEADPTKSGEATVTVGAEAPPLAGAPLSIVSAKKATGAPGRVTITIQGAGFQPNAKLELKHTPELLSFQQQPDPNLWVGEAAADAEWLQQPVELTMSNPGGDAADQQITIVE